MSLFEQLPENSFLRKLLLGEDSAFVERFLHVKKNFETATEKEDKRLYKDQMTGLFWDLYGRVALQIGPHISTAKKMFLRYGLMDLRYLTPEDQNMILKMPTSPPDYKNETIFYADEWLQGVAEGHIKASAVDEVSNASSSNHMVLPDKINERTEKYESLIAVEKDRFERFLAERNTHQEQLKGIISALEQQEEYVDLGIKGLFSEHQIAQLDEILFHHKSIKRAHKDMSTSFKSMQKAFEALQEIKSEYQGDGQGGFTSFNVVAEKITNEVGSLRQMAKMTVGRQGNNFPYLTSNIMPKETKDYLFKDTVKKKLQQWMEYDPEVFNREYRGDIMNIPPYIILLPGYGTIGACWEPLDATNKQFGKGRLALPIFSRIPDVSLLSAMADIRWQAAKEIASYYWMEEGLTGRYYEYYLTAKLKGDLRNLFISDYLLWMTKEIQGVQKLTQDARYVFWRYVPLPKEKKEWLSKKGYYYTQLWEKEQVWRQGQDKK